MRIHGNRYSVLTNKATTPLPDPLSLITTLDIDVYLRIAPKHIETAIAGGFDESMNLHSFRNGVWMPLILDFTLLEYYCASGTISIT